MKATCSIDGCDRPRRTRGWCKAHYLRWWTTGDAGAAAIMPRYRGAPCAVDGCDRSIIARSLCTLHYQRWQDRGDPTAPRIWRSNYPTGPDHPLWGGDDVGYTAVHRRLDRYQGYAKAHRCCRCGAPAEHWAYDHLDPAEKSDPLTGAAYSADPARYSPMCAQCHKRFDVDWKKGGTE